MNNWKCERCEIIGECGIDLDDDDDDLPDICDNVSGKGIIKKISVKE